MLLLSEVIPTGLDAFFVCDRADQLADGLRWLFGTLPMVSSLAVKTALFGAARAAGLGNLDLLDPLGWKLRGLDLSKGLAVWALPGEGGAVVLVGVHREREARETGRALCASPKVNFQDLGDLTLVLEDGAGASAFGVLGGYLWLATRCGSSDAARAMRDRIRAALDGQVDERARSALAEAPASSSALRMLFNLEQSAVAATVTVARNEVELTFRLEDLGDSRDMLQFLATRSPERNLARFLPRGALLVFSGLDLGSLLEDPRLKEPVVGLAVLHEIEPRIVSMLHRKAGAEEILRSGVLRASFLARVRDEELWRQLAAGSIERHGGDIHQRRDPVHGERTVYALLRGDALLWVAVERGWLHVALSEPDLDEARAAARLGVGGLEASIDDVETRRLLMDGEPVIHLKIADLTDRFSGLVGELWSGREVAAGLGVRELLKFLAKMPHATAQMTLDAPEDGRGMDVWLKLRVR